jgi:hypothetical protein
VFSRQQALKIQFPTSKTQFDVSSCVEHQKLKKPPLLILEDDEKQSSYYTCHYMTAVHTLHAGKGTLQKQSPCYLLVQV